MFRRDPERTRTEDQPVETADIAGRRDERRQQTSEPEPVPVDEYRDQRTTGDYRDQPTTSGQSSEKMYSSEKMMEQTREGMYSPEKDGHLTPLLPEDETRELQSRWNEIQAEFVDEPRGTLQKADRLVADVMTRVADGFAQQRSELEKQLESGEKASTEDLRVGLQRYRSFFQRLLSI